MWGVVLGSSAACIRRIRLLGCGAGAGMVAEVELILVGATRLLPARPVSVFGDGSGSVVGLWTNLSTWKSNGKTYVFPLDFHVDKFVHSPTTDPEPSPKTETGRAGRSRVAPTKMSSTSATMPAPAPHPNNRIRRMQAAEDPNTTPHIVGTWRTYLDYPLRKGKEYISVYRETDNMGYVYGVKRTQVQWDTGGARLYARRHNYTSKPMTAVEAVNIVTLAAIILLPEGHAPSVPRV